MECGLEKQYDSYTTDFLLVSAQEYILRLATASLLLAYEVILGRICLTGICITVRSARILMSVEHGSKIRLLKTHSHTSERQGDEAGKAREKRMEGRPSLKGKEENVNEIHRHVTRNGVIY